MASTTTPESSRRTARARRDAYVVIPLKTLSRSKTRVALAPGRRRALAAWLFRHALTTAGACVGSDHVVVVTSDPWAARLAGGLGMTVVTERSSGLNAAVTDGVDHARRCSPRSLVVVMVADLPRMTIADLARVLDAVACSPGPCHVADLDGAGTTLISLPPGTLFHGYFGPGSAALFRAAGYRPVEHAPEGLRADLDTLDDVRRLMPTWPLAEAAPVPVE